MKSKLFFLVIFFILFVSCEEKSDIPHTTVDILIEYPSDLEELSVQYETVKFKNISSGMETEYSNSKQFSLPEGLYDCSYEASVAYLKTLADCKDIVRLLIRAVRNANATRQVDKFNICAGLFFQLDRHLK